MTTFRIAQRKKRLTLEHDGRWLLFDPSKIEPPVESITATKRPGFVYLFHARNTSRYKIGITKNIETRLKSANTHSPYPVSCIAFIKSNDAKALESNLHRHFSEQRVHGEWFELTPAHIAEFMLIDDEVSYES